MQAIRMAFANLCIAAAVLTFSSGIAQSVPPRYFNDLQWRLIGPFRGGRSVAVSGVPGDGTTYYFGAVGGGVWKTTDAGTVWKPMFDQQAVASIGALAVSPADPRVIYAGTGESDIRSDLASGAGVYKSTDGGETWKYLGLKETRQISKIAVDPLNPNIVYVGAFGHAYGPNPERGVYKSQDGGTTWKKTLENGPDIGVADIAIASSKPSELFASVWNAHRAPWSTYAPLPGPGSGLYRSLDSGETWQKCSGHGLPEGTWGRSGVAVSADGRRIYALVEARKSGLYVSDDGGDNWSVANSDPRLTSRAWYFSRITVDPNDANVFYVPNIALMGSTDGGKTVFVVRGAPGGDDYHELWIDPKNSSRMILGTDQGTTITMDRGKTWSSWYNQPTAQLYHVTTDDRFPYVVYGSQQDSGGMAVYSRTDHQQITPRDWFPASGSESGYVAVDPRDADILYVSGAYGSVVRFDRNRGLSQDISPWPVPVFGTEIARRRYRAPWTPPLIFSPLDKNALYLGTQMVLKTSDAGLHWTEISPDLTGAKDAAKQSPDSVTSAAAASAQNSLDTASRPDMPTVENAIERGYGVITTVAPSYTDKDVLWTGSDTGLVHVTRDGGNSWTNVTPPNMQPWSRISQIDPSHFDPSIAYVSVERHRMDDQDPYMYRTTDFGKHWIAITTGLAAPEFVNAIREDPKQRGLLYAATEFGVDVSFDNGDHWQPLRLNLPATSVRDLTAHGDDLVIATHGRSFWILDDITPLRQLVGRKEPGEPFLFRPETAIRVDNDGFPGTPLPPEEPTAKNPPDGAILDYYLPATASKLELRIYDTDRKLVQHVSSEQESKRDHGSLPIAERWFPAPQHLEISAGMHRFIWNLTWGTSGVKDSDEPDDGNGDVPRGPRVAPGIYSIELEADGSRLPAQLLDVKMDPRSSTTSAELRQQFVTSYRIFADSLECRRTLAETASVREQISKIIEEKETSRELSRQAKSLEDTIDGLLTGASDRGAKAMGLTEANAFLTAALHVAESSDRNLPAQALVVYESGHKAAGLRAQEWSAIKNGALKQFNQQLERENLQPIGIARIEEQVQYLMTR